MKYCVVDSPDATIQSNCYAANKLLTKISCPKIVSREVCFFGSNTWNGVNLYGRLSCSETFVK